MTLKPPILPMLAKRVDALPQDGAWIFEPKWDGFRSLVFRDGTDVYLQSRDGRPLARYFPELLPALASQLPKGSVVDGEIVIARGDTLDFEALQLRLHPAATRIQTLARQTPAAFVAFDLLALNGRDLRRKPFEARRTALAALLAGAHPPLHLTPTTRDRRIAGDWFRRFEGAGLDGVMAKRSEGIYESDKRVMLKIKHARECDCVVGGVRWHKDGSGEAVGSLLLGLFDANGVLQHVGVCASFTMQRRRELVKILTPYRVKSLRGHPWRAWAESASATSDRRLPGASSRWSQGKDLSWQPLRPRLVVEVGYDHMQGDRFRHTAQFRRWRDDKPPKACTFEQLEVVPPHELAAIFAHT